MPLDYPIIYKVTEYYKQDIKYQDCVEQFKFINDENLKERLAQEFYVARYAAKMQEALNLGKKSFEMLGHQKIQIIQFAGIYEAVISHLLSQRLANNPDVEFLQTSYEYKPVPNALSKVTTISYEGENLYLCRQKKIRTPWKYISFEKKLEVAERIGIIQRETAQKMNDVYKARNSIHIEKAVEDEIQFSIEMCKLAYLTLYDMSKEITNFLLTKMSS